MRISDWSSDVCSSDLNMLSQIDQRYPALRFECLIAEYEDVVALVQQGRAHLGLMAAQDDYPPDVAHATLTELSEIVLCVGHNHPQIGRASCRERVCQYV